MRYQQGFCYGRTTALRRRFQTPRKTVISPLQTHYPSAKTCEPQHRRAPHGNSWKVGDTSGFVN